MARKHAKIAAISLVILVTVFIIFVPLPGQRETLFDRWITTKVISKKVEKAPDFSLPDLSGKKVALSEYEGKVVLLNIWATWCPPCRAEMPDMERLHKMMRGNDFIILAVAQDREGYERVKNFVRYNRISFKVLLDPQGKLAKLYGIRGYPETFVINKRGEIVKHIIGPRRWAEPPWPEYFKELVSKKY